MEIDYTNSRSDYAIHSGFASRRSASHHYYWVVYWAVMAGFGVYASLTGGLVFIAAIVAGMYIAYFVRAVPYSKVLESALERTLLFGATKRVRLRLDDGGLHETVEGQVQSFAPWPAIRRFAIIHDRLLIELTGDLWANIPRKTVAQGDAAFDQIVEILRSHHVKEDCLTATAGKVAALEIVTASGP